MTGHCLAGASAVAGLIVVSLAAQIRQEPFRATTDLVSVDVVVRDRQGIVSDLASKDFVLEDNGVRQELEAVSIDSLPIDVTLVMDVSASVTGEIERFKTNIRNMVALLRPLDRVRIITVGSTIREVEPLRTAGGVLPALRGITTETKTALNDGIFYAVARPAERDRRHLVVAFTDGSDTSSVIDGDTAVAIASQADAVLHVVLAESGGAKEDLDRSRAALEDSVIQTGGDIHKLRDEVTSFREVFDGFRASYVLSYSLRGVKREGWHVVRVKIAKPGDFTVRARKRYFIG